MSFCGAGFSARSASFVGRSKKLDRYIRMRAWFFDHPRMLLNSAHIYNESGDLKFWIVPEAYGMLCRNPRDIVRKGKIGVPLSPAELSALATSIGELYGRSAERDTRVDHGICEMLERTYSEMADSRLQLTIGRGLDDRTSDLFVDGVLRFVDIHLIRQKLRRLVCLMVFQVQ